MIILKKFLSIVLALLLAFSLIACSDEEIGEFAEFIEEISAEAEPEHDIPSEPAIINDEEQTEPEISEDLQNEHLDEYGDYSLKDEVALYISQYGHLPPNFITKNEARDDYGWSGGGLPDGLSIGGDVFGNREGLLPKETGRIYYECDIDTANARSRGEKRLVFSDDGLIFYTDDHYESFTQLFPEG